MISLRALIIKSPQVAGEKAKADEHPELQAFCGLGINISVPRRRIRFPLCKVLNPMVTLGSLHFYRECCVHHRGVVKLSIVVFLAGYCFLAGLHAESV